MHSVACRLRPPSNSGKLTSRPSNDGLIIPWTLWRTAHVPMHMELLLAVDGSGPGGRFYIGGRHATQIWLGSGLCNTSVWAQYQRYRSEWLDTEGRAEAQTMSKGMPNLRADISWSA